MPMIEDVAYRRKIFKVAWRTFNSMSIFKLIRRRNDKVERL